MEKKVFVTSPFPARLEHKARIEAARRRISRSEFVRRAVAEYLARLTADNSRKEVNDVRKYG